MAVNTIPPERFTFFLKGTQINRRSCARVVPMRVLVLGFPRTGTASMRIALKQLVYEDTYHFASCVQNPLDAIMWDEALEAKYFGRGNVYGKGQWDQLLGHCQAVCDIPCAAFMPELIAAYPDAKVILTNRDLEAWKKSVMSTIDKAAQSRFYYYLYRLDFTDSSRFKLESMKWKLWDALFQGNFPDNGKKVLVEKYDDIRRLVPKERLLEYEVGEGWERLCAFLGHDVPDSPFPRVNDTATFVQWRQFLRKRVIERALRTVLPILGVFVAAACAYWYHS